MANKNDDEFVGEPPATRRGRPPTGQAKSNAQRQAEYRLRKATEKRQAHRTMKRLSDDEILEKFVQRLREGDEIGAQDCWIEMGLRRAWKLF